MIEIWKNPIADTRTCDFKSVTKDQLLDASRAHIHDVWVGLDHFAQMIGAAQEAHDTDKITDIDSFHADFITGFAPGHTAWWDRHRTLNRHHLTVPDGTPRDVNLVDVLDFVTDVVMAFMARTGSVPELVLSPELLTRAFQNTVTLLKAQVVVRE